MEGFTKSAPERAFPVGCLWVSSVAASTFSQRFWNICSAGWRRLAAEMSWVGMYANECCRCLLPFCFWINSRRILMKVQVLTKCILVFVTSGLVRSVLRKYHSLAWRRHYGMMDGFCGIQFDGAIRWMLAGWLLKSAILKFKMLVCRKLETINIMNKTSQSQEPSTTYFSFQSPWLCNSWEPRMI